MSNIKDTLQNLKTIIQDENCQRMNLSTVKGYYGELLVKDKLEKEGCAVEHKGNQSGYDLEVGDITIDVKCSSFKEEIKGFPRYWGWALRHKSKKRIIKHTHFICVALDDSLNVESFYVIKRSDMEKFPSGFGQFKSVMRSFVVSPENIAKYPTRDIENAFIKSKNLILNNIAVGVRPLQSLKNQLKI